MDSENKNNLFEIKNNILYLQDANKEEISLSTVTGTVLTFNPCLKRPDVPELDTPIKAASFFRKTVPYVGFLSSPLVILLAVTNKVILLTVALVLIFIFLFIAVVIEWYNKFLVLETNAKLLKEFRLANEQFMKECKDWAEFPYQLRFQRGNMINNAVSFKNLEDALALQKAVVENYLKKGQSKNDN